MKKLHSLLVILLMSISTISFAQGVNEVTLTVSSDGPTKDEAVKNALRSAIEQAYGTFVSANTTILNDDLVKDEIVTVSNGSIKGYKELACVPTQNGGQFVTLKATVSLPHLIKYSQSKGSECEFAGNSFGMAMKLFELQKENEMKALYNLTTQVESILPIAMKHVITVGEPSIPNPLEWKDGFAKDSYGSYRGIRTKYANLESDNNKSEDLESLLLFLRMDVSKKSKHYDSRYVGVLNMEAENMALSTIEHIEDYYEVPIKISWLPSQDLSLPIMNVLRALCLSSNEVKSIQGRGLQTTRLIIGGGHIFLRNEPDSIYKWAFDFNSKFIDEFCNFVIVDNTGQQSNFYPREIFDRWFIRDVENKRLHSNPPRRFPNEVSDGSPIMLSNLINHSFGILGEGLYHNLFRFDDSGVNADNKCLLMHGPELNYRNDVTSSLFDSLKYDYHWTTKVLIPKSEIGKYSNFRIESAK